MNDIDYDEHIKKLLSSLPQHEPQNQQLVAATIEHLERCRNIRLFGSMAMMQRQFQMGAQPT